ncbi:FAD-binding protein [Streptomyces sp. F63]|uniref:FAD-binding protein n=1 Tax=Streptomyces sp. F63 TaxID=2824887 RepID=UPI001B37FEAD|nr:FAD-binding protein [Streptomyces sp. F63]MBQ0983763.1 FAD-binding protein [Streptomyces sp. F63]
MNLHTPSRRTVLGAVGATATVVGWNVTAGSWAWAGDTTRRPGDRVVSVPELDGTLTTDTSQFDSYAHDFGRLVTGTIPWAVLTPGSVRDIAKMIRYARSNNLKLAVNGRSGTGGDLESHSCYGQAAVPGGIAVNARGMARVLSTGAGTVTVEAGATFAEITDHLLSRGRTLPALPDYLPLSVGGTLSVGGIGLTMGTEGLIADTVESLVVVTGTGEVVTTSPTRRPELFRTALAGGGQVGVIVQVTLRTVPAAERATVFSLYYDDVASFMTDSEVLLADHRFQMQGGEMLRRPDGSGWRYKIEAVATYSGGRTPDRARLLRGLTDLRDEAHAEDYALRDYLFRLDGFEAFLKEGGYWEQPKPWLSLFLPRSAAAKFLRLAESELTPDDLGAGVLLSYPYLTSNVGVPLAVQPGDRVGYLFDLLRFPHPGTGAADIDRMVQQNRWLYDRAVALGAKRYLVGAVPDLTPADWRRHFGSSYKTLCEAKKRFDPDRVLTPGQGFFG